MSPKVSVLMPIYNAERFLRESIDSILGQTLTDFEFVIVDDGSTDATAAIVRSYDDPRIRLLRNDRNLGLPRSLNAGARQATGKYIARMDGDDVSLPERLVRQVAFMDAHPAVGACGVWAKDIDDAGRVVADRARRGGPDLNRYYWIPSPLIHPSAVIRAELLKSLEYDPRMHYGEDYDLWLRIVRAGYALENIPEYLFLYRVHQGSISDSSLTRQLEWSYQSFCRHIDPLEIPPRVYFAFFYSSCDLSPPQHALTLWRLSRVISRPYRQFLWDDVRYAGRWLRHHGVKTLAHAPAFAPLRYVRRRLRSIWS